VTFSNPAGSAAAAAGTYVRGLLEVLGPRDPVEVLAELVPWVSDRIQGLDDATLRRPEAPGKWSVIEVLQHLADSDLVFSYRLKMMMTEDRPPIQGYDQDRWAGELRYRDAPLDLVLDQLRGMRAANLHLVRRLSPAQLERVGMHSERGAESAGFLLRLMGAHDLVHRRQIDRILSAVTLVMTPGT
jgi:hypothetical protein